MSERALREALQAVPVDPVARERSRRVVRAAPAAARASRRELRRRRLSAFVLVGLLALASVAAAAASAPDSGLGRWVRGVLGAGEPPPGPALVRVPGGGRLLVQAGDGTWVVSGDGAMRRLGAFDGASWSPRGLFVVAWRGGQLSALDPRGDVRWSLARPGRVESARWAPADGFRVAYLAGARVRVVNGDGTGDHLLAAARAHVAPAWRPGAGHVLAYVDPRARATVVAVDSGRRLWRSAPVPGARRLSWSAAGDRLAVVGRSGVVVLGPHGRATAIPSGPSGAVAEQAVWAPHGGRLALVRHDPALDRSEVVVVEPARAERAAARGGPAAHSGSVRGGSAPRGGSGAARGGSARVLLSAPGRLATVAWSPDGRRLLVPWPAAGQWLFLPPNGGRPVAVAHVADLFAPGGRRARFPRDAQWCCAPR